MGEFASNLGISSGGGKRYTISRGTSRTSIEDITRQGLSEDVLKRLAARRPVVDDSGEADFRFGGPSKFTAVTPAQPTNPSHSVIVGGGDDGEDEVPPEAVLLVFNEVQKQTEDVRVENPDDPDQYVIVRRRLWSVFLGPDGVYRQFVYNNEGLS